MTLSSELLPRRTGSALLGQPTPLPSRPRASAGRTLPYHTFDPVNLATLEELAQGLGLAVEHREPRDGLATAPVILIDADFWWTRREDRERGLCELLQRESRPVVIGVHGWQLDDDQLDWLEQNGVHARNRLDLEIVAILADELACLPADDGASVRTT